MCKVYIYFEKEPWKFQDKYGILKLRNQWVNLLQIRQLKKMTEEIEEIQNKAQKVRNTKTQHSVRQGGTRRKFLSVISGNPGRKQKPNGAEANLKI